HAAGHIDGVGPLLGDAPFAPAVAARAGDLLTGAAAVAARGRRHHLAKDRPPHPVHLAAAAALAARRGRRAWQGAAALAGRTGDWLAQPDLALGAEHSVLEAQVEGDLHVGTLAGAGSRAPAAERGTPEASAEEALEQVAETGGEGTGIETGAACGAARVGTEKVVASPALGLAQ